MPVLQAFNVSHQFDNGETLFQSISCSMTKRRVGLVGRNGIGKSLLASILAGETQPASGVVTSPSSFMMYRQQPSDLLSGQQSIAQFLGTDSVLHALKQIEQGDVSEHWFELVGEQWDIELKLKQQLAAMGLPQDPGFSCARLSGGQLARLQLWQLFENETELLILDEPSNHLDTEAKQWLIESMRHFGGAILLISHDRELLREMEEIWELSGLGLQVFGGNYDVYAEQKRTELQAVERQLAQVDKQKKRLAEQAQKNREKADQRAAQGNKLRKDGSQPKICLMAKRIARPPAPQIAIRMSNSDKCIYKPKSGRCNRDMSSSKRKSFILQIIRTVREKCCRYKKVYCLLGILPLSLCRFLRTIKSISKGKMDAESQPC